MSETFYLRAYTETQGDDVGGAIRFVASTEGVKRDGRDLKAADWRLDSYLRNPVFLWCHDFSRPPIGRVTGVTLEQSRLIADVVFDSGDPFAVDVERKYRNGFLNAVSVGWNDQRDGSLALMDISAVPIPADPDALIERQRSALRSLQSDISTLLSSRPDEARWYETATEMVGLYVPGADDSDEARRARYNALLPRYRKLGKVAPEFIDGATLSALGADEIRGLFLSGEPELCPDLFVVRVGAVLSSRNRTDLEQAITLIQSVIERATKEAEPQPEPEPQRETPAPEPNYDQILRALQLRLATAQLEMR